MNSESDYTVNIPSEISAPIPVSTRKDLTKQARESRKRRRRDRRRRTEEKPSEAEPPPDESTPAEGEQEEGSRPRSVAGEDTDDGHEVDYLA